MHTNEHDAKTAVCTRGRELEDALLRLHLDHVMFSIEGDEIDGRVLDIGYFNDVDQVDEDALPLEIKTAVRARLELDARVYDFTSGSADQATRLRWDLAER